MNFRCLRRELIPPSVMIFHVFADIVSTLSKSSDSYLNHLCLSSTKEDSPVNQVCSCSIALPFSSIQIPNPLTSNQQIRNAVVVSISAFQFTVCVSNKQTVKARRRPGFNSPFRKRRHILFAYARSSAICTVTVPGKLRMDSERDQG